MNSGIALLGEDFVSRMRSKSKTSLAVLFCSVLSLAVFTSCGNSNFFPSQTAIISMSVTPTNNLVTPGGTANFYATGTLGNGSTADVTSSVTWTSSNTGVATISAGVVTGVSVGTSTITATANHITVQSTVLVSNITSFTISPTTWTPIESGATQQFTATGSDGSPITDYVGWTSSDTTCATISNAGLATFVGTLDTSTCTITATLGNLPAQTANVGTSGIL